MTRPIAIAMSGGIDSTFAAFTLKSKGKSIIGIHFITGFEPALQSLENRPGENNQRKVIETFAASVEKRFEPLIKKLCIPFHVVDIQKAFKEQVVDYFVSTYLAGQTPNPCLVCNPTVKFGILLEKALDLGASHLATGHYARILKDDKGVCHLLKGLDDTKDQSYFLSRLNQYQLKRALFPLGEMRKTDVRATLKKNGISPLSKEESQDICFIGKGGYPAFLSQFSSKQPEKGMIVDEKGKVLGEHNGLSHFTIGQRRGINCPGTHPYYVIRMDTKNNQLIVGEKKSLSTSYCMVRKINWVVTPFLEKTPITVKIRYRHRAVQAMLTPMEEKSARLDFISPQEAVTPGQGAVFYMENEILGGGFIQ